ncbi:MAG: DUF3313 family protein [Chromatiales bacterium]|nr:DUF3313 family protein [Chromatiales bacterium]
MDHWTHRFCPALARALAIGLVAGLATLGTGCAQPGATRGDDPAERALLTARNRNLDLTWLESPPEPGVYRRVAVEAEPFDYRDVPPVARNLRIPPNRSEFPISERDREELERLVVEIFREELGRSERFALSDESAAPAADLLLVRVRLLDVISRVPPEPAQRSRTFIDSVGEATLVLELVDSTSGSVLARAADRRSAEPAGSPGPGGFRALRSSRVTAWQEVRRATRRWARVAVGQLDQLPGPQVAASGG